MIRAACPTALTSCWHDSCCTPYCLKKITVINLIVKEGKLQRSGTTHVLQTATKENESQVLFANVRKTLHTEDLVIVAHKVEVRKTQFQWSHLNLEAKGLKANKTKKKVLLVNMMPKPRSTRLRTYVEFVKKMLARIRFIANSAIYGYTNADEIKINQTSHSDRPLKLW